MALSFSLNLAPNCYSYLLYTMQYTKLTSIFLLMIALCGQAFAQNTPWSTYKTTTSKAKQHFDQARDFLRTGQIAEALKKADAAYKADPKFLDALLLKASAYNVNNQLAEAEEVLENVIKIDENYDPDIWFSVAQTERKQEKFTEATIHYDKFLASKSTNTAARKQTQDNIEQCRFIGNAMANPVPFEPKALSASINTSIHSEYLPCLTADQNTLVFTRRSNDNEDFYISQKIEGEWQEAIEIPNVNTTMNEGAQSISADGRYMVFTACNRRDGMGSCDLFFSELTEKGWSKPQNMGEPISTRAWESQPSLSADGNILYFASSRAGGQGGNDIWVSSRIKGKWQTPINAGAAINTTGDDEGPFIHQDNQTLYMMSNGRPSIGGYDLYFARKGADGTWQTPQNMGYPINSKRDEGGLIISLDGKKALMASDRKYKDAAGKGSVFNTTGKERLNLSGRTETDIYEFDLYEAARPKAVTYVEGKVYDAQTLNNLQAKIDISDVATGQVISSITSNWKGEFLLCLPAGKNYAFTVQRAKYAFYSNNFALAEQLLEEKPFHLDVPLIPITAGVATTSSAIPSKTVVLKNVFFETGSAKLLPVSITELDRLKSMLDENPSLRIQLNGHTDDVGAHNDNMTLSSNRAKAVQDYLIQKGINSNRLTSRGFGETRPIVSNDTPEGRQENRRTEFEIVGF